MSDPIEDMPAELIHLRVLNEEIDQLASSARDCEPLCSEVQPMLDLAWWFTEDAIREATGRCSMGGVRWQEQIVPVLPILPRVAKSGGTYPEVALMLARLLSFWCRWFHNQPMHPIHGHYRCRRCLRVHPAAWI